MHAVCIATLLVPLTFSIMCSPRLHASDLVKIFFSNLRMHVAVWTVEEVHASVPLLSNLITSFTSESLERLKAKISVIFGLAAGGNFVVYPSIPHLLTVTNIACFSNVFTRILRGQATY